MFLIAGAFVAALGICAPANAVVRSATAIDGPSGDILELGGVAMSEDGSGGLVYRKRVDGRPHVFAAAFRYGAWQPPQRVDVGQEFESRWPRIAAGDGGRLVVVWTQDWVPTFDRLFSATLDPGATRFQAPVAIDYDVGKAFETNPSLAMNRGGAAYLAYHVVTNRGEAGNLPPGYVEGELRAARYNGLTWSRVGTRLDRVATAPIRVLTAANAAKVAIDDQGGGLVAWQEPDEGLVDRVWARRLFGDNVGVPLAVSPQRWDDRVLDGPADQFSLSMGDFGGGAVAFRQQPGQSSLGAARIMVNTIPETFGDEAKAFLGPRLVEGGAPGQVGPVSVGALPVDGFAAAFSSAGLVRAVSGDRDRLGAPEPLGVGGDPALALSKSGRRVAAWATAGGVRLQERPSAVAPADAELAGGSGPIGSLLLDGSGHGDAIAAFAQGHPEQRTIAAGIVDGPPGRFLLLAPDGWRRGRLSLSWEPAVDSFGPVTYTLLEGRRVIARTRHRRLRLTSAAIANGRHRVRVVATDRAGQTAATAQTVLVDRRPPRVRIGRRGATASVRVRDGRKRVTAGVARRTTVSWGDGKRARGRGARATHRYAAGGRYRIVVRARDRAGNKVTSRRTIVVRAPRRAGQL